MIHIKVGIDCNFNFNFNSNFNFNLNFNLNFNFKILLCPKESMLHGLRKYHSTVWSEQTNIMDWSNNVHWTHSGSGSESNWGPIGGPILDQFGLHFGPIWGPILARFWHGFGRAGPGWAGSGRVWPGALRNVCLAGDVSTSLAKPGWLRNFDHQEMAAGVGWASSSL